METKAIKMGKITKTALSKKLGISRQSLYYQPKRDRIDSDLRMQIESVLGKNPDYGHKRIATALKLNKKRVLRVMKKFKIKPYRKRARKPFKKDDQNRTPENGINIYRLLCPIRPNIVWVSDFTYLKYNGRFIYAATVMDMFTREIIGAGVSRFHNVNLVLEAFIDAELKTGIRPLFLHSDQGSEYTSKEYKEYIKNKKIIISFSDKGSPWQNGYQESFYQGFKLYLGVINRFETLGEVIEGIYQAFYYYNNDRIHTAFNMSPVAFKKLYLRKSLRQFV